MSNSKERRREFIKNSLFGFFVFILFFGSLEGLTRLIVESNTLLNINIGGIKEYHPRRGAMLKPNYEGSGMITNSYGMLGDEFEIEPRPGSIRILTIGDSVTFHPPERNYPSVLKEELSRQFPGIDVEIINGAIPGYASYEALDWYREFLHQLQPQIITIYLGWNDIGQYHPFGLRYKNERHAYQERTLVGWLMENLYLLRIPYFFLGRLENSIPIDLTPLTKEEADLISEFEPAHFRKNLDELVSEIQEKQNAKIYIATLASLATNNPEQGDLEKLHFPRGMSRKFAVYQAVADRYEAVLEELAEERNIELIDLRPLISSKDRAKYFTDTMHVTHEGAELYGAAFARSLQGEIARLLKARTNRDAAQPSNSGNPTRKPRGALGDR